MLNSTQIAQARMILSRPSTFGTTGAGLCLQIVDDNCLEWDPAILDQELTQLLGGEYINDDVLQRIQAVGTVLGSASFFQNPQVFHAVCCTLLDPDTDPAAMTEPPSPAEMAWSCAEVQLLLGPQYRTANYRPDVSRYCGVSLESSGLHFPPATLRFADFPGEQYPDASRYADETLLTGWIDAQQKQVSLIDASIIELTGILREQLLELRPFGGIEEQFNALAQVSSASRSGKASSR
jgi:hypothetical protein